MLDATQLAQLRRAAEDVLCDRHVLVAYVFGSRISGRPRPDIILDVGYYLEAHRDGASLPIAEEMRLASRALGSDRARRRLAEPRRCLTGIARPRTEEGIRIYSGNPPARVALERELLGRYHDYKEIFQEMHARRLRAVAERGL